MRRTKTGQWDILKDMVHGADVIVEVVDARNVPETRLPLLERFSGSKRLLILANKADLLGQGVKHPHLPNKGLCFSAKKADERARRALIRAILDRTEKRPVKALFLGYPNIGKSSIINLLARRQAAKVSSVAGTTKNIQWVRVDDTLTVSDYRGVYPKHEKREELVRKGALNVPEDAEAHAHRFIRKALSEPALKRWLEKEYDVDLREAADTEAVLGTIARRRGWVLKGGEPNLAEAARHLVRAMKEAPSI